MTTSIARPMNCPVRSTPLLRSSTNSIVLSVLPFGDRLATDWRIGMDIQDELILLVFVGRVFHDEITAMQYGENTFASTSLSSLMALPRSSSAYLLSTQSALYRAKSIHLCTEKWQSLLRCISKPGLRRLISRLIARVSVEAYRVPHDEFGLCSSPRTARKIWPAMVAYVEAIIRSANIKHCDENIPTITLAASRMYVGSDLLE